MGVVMKLLDNPLRGITAMFWSMTVAMVIEEEKGVYKLIWCNSNLEEDWYNVALYIQLGHATASGAWVEGVDYINPALAPIFNKMADEVWNEFSTN